MQVQVSVLVLACFLLQGSGAIRSTNLHSQVTVDEPVDEPVCLVGRGGAWYTRFQYVIPASIGINQCISMCKHVPRCVGIDFSATKKTSDACRLYGPNKPRLGDGGKNERQYCIVRHKLNESESYFGWMGRSALSTTSTTTTLDPLEVEEALHSWINSQGEKEVDCGLSEKKHGRMRAFLSSSFFDVNDTFQDDSILVNAFMSFKPEGRAIWIGDATKGARPFWARFTYFPPTQKKMRQKTNISLQKEFIDAGCFGKQETSIEGMEDCLEDVGVVYLADRKSVV